MLNGPFRYPIKDTSVRTRTLSMTDIGDAPMTLKQAKNYLKVYHDEDDEDLPAMINEAYGVIESRTGRMIRTFTATLTMDTFPFSGPIVLPRPPLTEVVSVQYYDASNTLTTLAGCQAQTAAIPGLIHLPIGMAGWPMTKERLDAVQIEFKGGGVEPEQLRRAARWILNMDYHDMEPAKAETTQKRIDGTLHGFTLRDPRLYGITM